MDFLLKMQAIPALPCQLRIQQARVIHVMNQGKNTTANWARGSDKIPLWNNASPMPTCQTDDSQCLLADSSIGCTSFRSHFLPIIDFNKSWIPATSMAVMCMTRRRADHAGGRGGVAGQCKGEHQSSVVLQVLAQE
jgi:hypothetical protein